ncbi:VapE domain-containing protein [Eubacterium sp. F2]|uniref:VapE domain-containing protein n=1 Tax=Eubacterium sp. F2 TaxID=3381348 RepID=UPI0039083642
MKISYGNSRKELHWKNSDLSWEDFKTRVSQTIKTTETVEEYKKMPKAKQAEIKDKGGYVLGHLKAGRRKKGHVLSRSALALDMDFGTPGVFEEVLSKLPYAFCIYSTHKHTPEHPRLRMIIPLSREVSEAEYPAVGRMAAKEIGIDLFDDSTYEAHRLMYWPSTSSNGMFFFQEHDGNLFDPDDYLSRYDDWRDESTWPVSSRQSEVRRSAVRKAEDPLSKPGLIGCFCRAYSVEDAIETFLPDVYAPSVISGRYDYIKGESSAGVVIYEHKFSYSHHATDPACGKLLNAFDLVRLHKFRDLDEACSDDTPVTKLPSYKAMIDLARGDAKVRELITGERREQAMEEFTSDDWMGKLTLNRRGNIENELGNLTLILQNDENLKAIVYNQQLDCLEIKGDVPWNHPTKYWRDADDAQLVSYVDEHYGNFSQRFYQIALARVADDRSYHPIREFLASLPAWDGVPRVDTLLIDYLGAEDNAYVRAVTRKTLCAAVCRVMHPGCKFDSMLVLNGPQGIGKSTLIAKLAGEWFSDSLNLSDTRDKTAAEKLQGYWILEIGELAGLRKAEVETLRSFLSRQNDIYRASFGRRTTPHPRQCVFFGTTNAETGYLRDTTGNRRFWPVKTPGSKDRHPWDLDEYEINQIWAEALEYAKAGEKLYLEPELQDIAKAEQLDAMESDEREGTVITYLQTKLPEGWDSMTLYERKNYLNGESEFGEDLRTGTVSRTSVSNIEIWCECFGKNRADLTIAEGNRIKGILIKLGWHRYEKKTRIPLYGPQWIYLPDNLLHP